MCSEVTTQNCLLAESTYCQMPCDSMRISKHGDTWRIWRIPALMAYFQSSVSRDLTTASSNAFTKNNVNKRKKGMLAPQSSRISLCCCIRLLQMRSTVMFLERSCHRLVGYDALTGTAEELPQT